MAAFMAIRCRRLASQSRARTVYLYQWDNVLGVYLNYNFSLPLLPVRRAFGTKGRFLVSEQ